MSPALPRGWASAVGELATEATADEPRGNGLAAPGAVPGATDARGKGGVRDREMRRCDEAVDDVVAASLGRSRMADGRRIELSVEELAQAVGAAEDAANQARRGADAS